jgi:branched-chain amino acid aminotransferase
VRLDQHLRRLEESAALQGQAGTVDPSAARRAVTLALNATANPESRLRLTFAPPRLFVAVEPFTPLPRRLYEQGVACVTLDVRRDNPHAKDTRFIAAAGGLRVRRPAEEAHRGEDGAILEGLSSNFFAVVDEALRTEEERALIGITRSLVLEVAEGLMPVERRSVRRDDLPHVAEAFVTSVSREVLPVVQIDDRPVGGGVVGPRTRAIMDGLAALVNRETTLL